MIKYILKCKQGYLKQNRYSNSLNVTNGEDLTIFNSYNEAHNARVKSYRRYPHIDIVKVKIEEVEK